MGTMEFSSRPFVVGIGGTTRPASSSESALRMALGYAEEAGAVTKTFGGSELSQLPMYDPGLSTRHPVAAEMIECLRRADGIIISSSGYHGTVSGLVKNALDYVEELKGDDRVYFAGRSVGCIAVAGGWQGAVTTLSTIREITHALRGWPTPMGAAINSSLTKFSADATCDDMGAVRQLQLVGYEVVDYCHRGSRPHSLVAEA